MACAICIICEPMPEQVSLACWAPVVALTGWEQLLHKIHRHSAWMARVQGDLRLPGAPLARIWEHWFVRPFSSEVVALVFWLLVITGAVAWWRSGRRRLVIIVVGAAACYLLTVPWILSYHVSIRYSLPALPMLAALAAGITVIEGRGLRRLLLATALIVVVLQVIWAAPAYLLRSRQPAPVWHALTWVAEHADPATTLVICHHPLKPHAQYLLRSTGLEHATSKKPLTESGAADIVWEVVPRQLVRQDRKLLFSASWSCRPLYLLTQRRHYDCAVQQRKPRATGAAEPASMLRPLERVRSRS
jgi:hypothetical protein